MPARMAYQVLGWSPGTAWQTPEHLRLSGHNLWRLPFLVVLPGEVPWGGSPGEGSDTAYTLPFSLLFPPRAHLLILQYLAPKRMCVFVYRRTCVCVRDKCLSKFKTYVFSDLPIHSYGNTRGNTATCIWKFIEALFIIVKTTKTGDY